MANPEHAPQHNERGLESIGAVAAERSAEQARSFERTAEHSLERQAEAADNALREAREASVSVEKSGSEQAVDAPSTHSVRPVATKASRKKAYKDILTHTQNELTPASRRFSKVIHQPVVEKTSAAVGSTVARPNAILFGSLFALILSGGIYLIARYYNYTLSGFEAIAAFIVGWAFGMLVDFIRLALRRR